MIVAFFGHADYVPTVADEEALLSLLSEVVGDAPCELFLGEYGAFDRFAYRCAQKYKRHHAGVRLIFVTPYPLEAPRGEVEECFDGILYPAIEDVPKRYAIVHRNRFMVEKADALIFYVRRHTGGAYKAYRYALSLQKVVYHLANEKKV